MIVYDSYLELHALRAPVGNYIVSEDEYDDRVREAIRQFERSYNVGIFCLGRSGRHICIEDTPANRRRYDRLQSAAIAATRALWSEMRTK